MSGFAQSGVIIALLVAALVAAGYFPPPSVRNTAKGWLSVIFGAFVIVCGADNFWSAFHEMTEMQKVATWLAIIIASVLVRMVIKYSYTAVSRPRESGTQS